MWQEVSCSKRYALTFFSSHTHSPSLFAQNDISIECSNNDIIEHCVWTIFAFWTPFACMHTHTHAERKRDMEETLQMDIHSHSCKRNMQHTYIYILIYVSTQEVEQAMWKCFFPSLPNRPNLLNNTCHLKEHIHTENKEATHTHTNTWTYTQREQRRTTWWSIGWYLHVLYCTVHIGHAYEHVKW